ncbi:hypothetical protein NDU88_002491 [Pleurodeles waltl]|uniref:Uncharacterized protein n=1 Tax=Pleurodeles waltl TaxID=8319 RepID=A0AAV7T3N2_PLEWA|nr:hypothetical protein NDU88_002491 [Pleurodeles waltl]
MGPRVSPQALRPSAHDLEELPGRGPSRGPSRLLRRSAAPPQLRGRGQLTSREQHNLVPAAAERSKHPGAPHSTGEPPGFPPHGPRGTVLDRGGGALADTS